MLPIGDQSIFAEKNNHEKVAISLLIVGTELIAYLFW